MNSSSPLFPAIDFAYDALPNLHEVIDHSRISASLIESRSRIAKLLEHHTGETPWER